MPKRPKTPKLLQLPRHPVDALVVLAKMGGLEDRLSPQFLKEARAYCDEPITAAQAEAERETTPGAFAVTAFLSEAGRAGGSATSPAKARAAKRNAKLGGRPKGSKDSYPRKRAK